MQKIGKSQGKLTHIEDQLKSTVAQMEEFSKGQKKDIDALQLLDIYLVLMGEVFSAASHVRLLFILHGEKEEYTMTELTKASGYPGLQVRTSIHELRNAKIVDLNEDTATVKLINRFM